MDFSVIIPVYNELANIKELLKSLADLQPGDFSCEIILVDNGSTDGTYQFLQSCLHSSNSFTLNYFYYPDHNHSPPTSLRSPSIYHTAEGNSNSGEGADSFPLPAQSSVPLFSLLQETTPGSYAARNRGIKEARGDYLSFTDGDCLVDRNWLLEAARVLEEEGHPPLLAGSIKALDPKKNLFARYDALCFLHQERLVSTERVATANLLVRRDVFDQVGLFNSQLMTGGDVEFAKRAVKRGFPLHYREEVKVYHRSRDSFAAVRDKLIRFWGNHVKYRSFRERMVSLVLLPGGRTVNRAFKKGEISPSEYAGLVALSFFLGLAVGWWALFRRSG